LGIPADQNNRFVKKGIRREREEQAEVMENWREDCFFIEQDLTLSSISSSSIHLNALQFIIHLT